MTKQTNGNFDPKAFLAHAGQGKTVLRLEAKEMLFCQGEACDAIFYIQTGRIKLTVVSNTGKEATITLLAAQDFVGEEAIAAVCGNRLAMATAVTPCTVLRIERATMLRLLHEESGFSDLFVAFLLARSLRTQSDLVDQLFNNSEKRLARTLLLMAEYGQPGKPETLIPEITQETLAAMIGTTRSRVSFFMNRFRKLGFIDYNRQDYNSRIRVHKSLLNVVLRD